VALSSFVSVQPDSRIILYGCGRIGKNVLNALNDEGISIPFFIDHNKNISMANGVPVISPDDYQPRPDDVVILCLYFGGIRQQVREELTTKGAANILDYMQLDKLLNKRSCDFAALEQKKKMCRACAVRRVDCPDSCLRIEENAQDRLCFEELTLLATSACVLNCKECAAKVPEYRRKNIRVDMNIDDFKSCWGTFRDAIDFIKICSVTGGEPLLYRNIVPLLELLCDEPKIEVVHVLTTGAAIFDDKLLEILSHEKVVITLDNYGNQIAEKAREIYNRNKEHMTECGINLVEIDNTNGTWHSLGEIEKRGRSAQELQDVFRTCYFSPCRYITQDLHFEMCGMPARLRHLGYDFFDPADTVDLHNKTPEKLRSEILNYLKKPFLTACDCCSGCNENNIVRAGIQASEDKQ